MKRRAELAPKDVSEINEILLPQRFVQAEAFVHDLTIFRRQSVADERRRRVGQTEAKQKEKYGKYDEKSHEHLADAAYNELAHEEGSVLLVDMIGRAGAPVGPGEDVRPTRRCGAAGDRGSPRRAAPSCCERSRG